MKKIEVWYQLPVTAEMDYIMECALKAEEIGFDGVSNEDHLWVKGLGAGCRPECWTMLTAIAAKTEKLKVTSLVTCILHRNPSLLAKIITTLDWISKGRVLLVYGACWWREELESFGYKWEEDKVRVERTIEAIKIIKCLFTENEVTFKGKYYSVKKCRLEPKPYQKPHPPIFCGGAGYKMRKFAAQYVDGWVMPINIMKDVDEYLRKRRIVEKYVGERDFIYGIALRFNPDKICLEDVEEKLKEYIRLGVTWINIRLDPDNRNLELIERIKPLILSIKRIDI